MKTVSLHAFAKVNLCLHVLGKRPDGYHELRTIFQAISLHDTLDLSFTPGGDEFHFAMECSDPSLPLNQENLVFRAVDAIRSEFGIRGSISASLHKRIPIARGLGGGSSDAAAALVGMLKLTEQELPLERLLEIASGLGADVPFFLFGGRALGVGRGDEIYPLPDGPKHAVLVVSPRNIGVSTKDAYQWIPQGVSQELTNRKNVPKLFGFCALCWSRQGAGVSNDFEGPVFSRHARLREIRDALLREGAAEAALAGSGSAVFGIFRNPAQARRAARKFPNDTAFVAETLSREKYGRALKAKVTG
jgi:4-diphosphocytidyl-2-C-methyl-D-erythritol kinase